MPDSIFDRLQKHLEVTKREQGISPIEIAELPPNLRKVMRLMLREVAMKYSEIVAAVAEMPAANRLSPKDLDAALATLVEQNWLNRFGSEEMTTYRVNLRRRSGSQLGADIWGTLDNKIGGAGSAKPKTDNPEDQN
jgi:hypothetical protein